MQKKIISGIIGFITGIGNGLFGSGGGTVAVPCMEKFLDVEARRAHATAVALILPLCVISGAVYFFSEPIPVKEAVLTSIGGIFGGMLGAKLLSKIRCSLLHTIFGIIMLAGGVRMIL